MLMVAATAELSAMPRMSISFYPFGCSPNWIGGVRILEHPVPSVACVGDVSALPALYCVLSPDSPHKVKVSTNCEELLWHIV